MKRHILITGSSGMLGIDLCQELKSDYDVIGMDLIRRYKSAVKPYIMGDITDRKFLQATVTKVSPDIVIHCAAWTDVDGCELDKKKAYKINSEGTRNIALACKACGAVMVYISTDFVFNGKKKTAYKESDKPAALSVYGDSKLRGENFVRKSLSNYFILRTSWLYGKFGKNFVDTIVAKAKTVCSLKVVKDQVGSPTCTKYLAQAIHKMLDIITIHDSRFTIYGTYHVSNSGGVSWYNYARKILKLVKSKTKIVAVTSAQLARPAKRPAMSILDNSKFIGFTGYRMPDWKIALSEYLSK